MYVLKNTATRGVISPYAVARDDIEAFRHSIADGLNILVRKEGPLTRRSGTKYLGELKHAEKDVRLVDFVFSSDQSYVLECGDEYIRFWTPDGQIESGGSPYEIVSPYAEDHLRDISWSQSNDVLYMALRSTTIKTQTLSRTGHTNWSFSDTEFVDGPYLPINDQQNIVECDDVIATGDTRTFTFANTANINGGDGFVSTDVGRHFRVQFKGKWSWGIISAVNSTTEIEVDIVEGNGGGGSGSDTSSPGGAGSLAKVSTSTTETGSNNVNEFESLSWRLGAFSDTTGYPSYVAQFQGRTFWGSTPANPRAVWYSRSNYPLVMSPSDVDGTVTEEHGGMVEFRGGRNDSILWMQEAPRLQIGTASAIRTLGASDVAEAFGPRNIHQRLELAQGVSNVRPAVIGSSTVHTNKFGTNLTDLYYDYQTNSLAGPDLTTVSDHLFKLGVRETVWQHDPNKTLWSILNTGRLVSTTVERYEKVLGFVPHDVSGFVFSGTAVPSSRQDEFMMAVRRTIDGSTVAYMEIMEPPFDGLTMARSYAYFMDCGGTYVGPPVSQVTGATWLNGEEVAVYADGAVMPRVTVVAGVVPLPDDVTASVVSFGIPIDAHCTYPRFPSQLPDGTGLGRKARVVSVHADLYDTLGIEFYSTNGVPTSLPGREPTDLMGSPPELITGVEGLSIEGSWSDYGQLSWRVVDPVPVTVRAVTIDLETE